MIFQNRKHAGELLARKLSKYQNTETIVFGLPRGGVPVAAEVASSLAMPLEVLVARKIGVPFQPEVALGAVCETGAPVWNLKLLARLGLEPQQLDEDLRRERNKIQSQIQTFRKGRTLQKFPKTAIVVDDGLATGATAAAAVKYLKAHGVAEIVVAVPVGVSQAARRLRKSADEVILIEENDEMMAVSEWYEDFQEVPDAEVVSIIEGYRVPDKKSAVQINRESGGLEAAIRESMQSVFEEDDWDDLVNSLKDTRVVMLGEASHGTQEFYRIRSLISQRLIRDHGFRFIAVEGDWPDLHRLNRYIHTGKGSNARKVLMQNHRWPTWMWANHEVADLAEWMRFEQAGFYGLDVYSLFDSMKEVIQFLKDKDPDLAREVERRYSCFNPFEGDEISYARSLLQFSNGCQKEVVSVLENLLQHRLKDHAIEEEALFSAQQNAWVVTQAESYYRAMLMGDANSWNVRDQHMMDTLDRLLKREGEGAKVIVWAHNTHIGDYRATDMKAAGYVNIGGLARERYGHENVALVGFGTHRGTVLAGQAWDHPEEVMPLPSAREGSYEHFFHQAALKSDCDQFFCLFGRDSSPEFDETRGHRAVGVVYDPARESRGQYVPTELSKRYDAFVFVDKTEALKSLHTPFVKGEFPETWPSGI